MEFFWRSKIAPSQSPRQLNKKGHSILDNSGVIGIINTYKENIFEQMKSKKLDNPYDAQIALEKILRELPKHHPEIIPTLKNGAFQTGTDFDTILFVGSIYLRDQIFPELGFDLGKKNN